MRYTGSVVSAPRIGGTSAPTSSTVRGDGAPSPISHATPPTKRSKSSGTATTGASAPR